MKIKLLTLTLSLLAVSFGLAYGQGSIVMDSATFLAGGQVGELNDGDVVVLWMHLNNTGDPLRASTNGFRITSDNGVTWDTATGELNPAYCWDLNWCYPCFYDLGMYVLDSASVDKIDPDTIGFGGAAGQFGDGIPTGFDDWAWTITVGPVTMNGGTHFTVDSSFYGTAGFWLFGIAGGIGVECVWGGPYDIPAQTGVGSIG
ncbi:MAG: hypothetical protein JSW34_08110, partial [Candidatus Zixiibacteriota bacterium]